MVERAETERKIIQSSDVKKFVTPGQKRQRRIALIAAAAVIVIAAGGYFLLVPKEKIYSLGTYETAAVFRGDLPRTAQASGSVSIPIQINVLSPEDGYASLLFVAEGDIVAEGDRLTVIDVPDLEDELSDLVLELEDAKDTLAKARMSNEIANARTDREIGRLKEELADALEEEEKLERLVAINASRGSELETQQDAVDNIRESIEEKELQLTEDRQLQALEEDLMRFDIDRMETSVRRLKEDIEAATVTSPMGGEILELEDALSVPGSAIVKNQKLFTVADTASAIIELEVDEEYAGSLEKEDSIVLDVGGTDLTGTISSIGRVAWTSSDGLGATVLVKVIPDIVSSAVIPGATAVGVFELGVLEDIPVLQRGPYLTTGSQRYLYVIEGDTARRTDVTFGESEGNYIQILDGVSEGDEVIVSGYQNYIEYETVKLEKNKEE